MRVNHLLQKRRQCQLVDLVPQMISKWKCKRHEIVRGRGRKLLASVLELWQWEVYHKTGVIPVVAPSGQVFYVIARANMIVRRNRASHMRVNVFASARKIDQIGQIRRNLYVSASDNSVFNDSQNRWIRLTGQTQHVSLLDQVVAQILMIKFNYSTFCEIACSGFSSNHP